MFIEHLIYSSAIAVLLGMVLQYYKKPNISWILIPMSISPDIDYFIWKTMEFVGFKSPFIIHHGDFHNLIGLVCISFISTIYFNRKNKNNFLFVWVICAFGFMLHLLEDMFVYTKSYTILYPFSNHIYGFGIILETGDLIIAGSKVLIAGLLFLISTIIIRTMITNDEWLNNHIEKYNISNVNNIIKIYAISLIKQINTFKYSKDK